MSALEGIKVLELSGFIAGPFAGMLLGDLGADVLKVEPPQGDPFRQWISEGHSPHFAAFNRNKRSVVLDTKSPKGREALTVIARHVDVVIQNLRPSAAARLGLTYAGLKESNPGVVVCGISAFGDRGPLVGEPGFDTMGQALSGLLSLLVDRADPRPVGPAMADQLCGIFAAYGILGALVERARTGEGQQVSTSLLSSSLAFVAEAALSAQVAGAPPNRFTRAAASQAYAFTCADGRALAVHLSSPEQFWQGLLEAVGDPSLDEDPAFATRANRVKNYDRLYARLAEVFRTRDLDIWLALLREHDVPCAPVMTVSDVPDHPQVREMNLIRHVTHSVLGESKHVSNPIDGAVQRLSYMAPPMLGEHTDEVLAEFGLAYQPDGIDQQLKSQSAFAE